MVPWLVLAAIILEPSAAFLLWSWRAQRNDMESMRATETTRAADVAKLPPGSLVEVKGRLRCDAPVTGELSNSPCAHFAATVERDCEIVEYDSRRKTSYRVRKTEIVTLGSGHEERNAVWAGSRRSFDVGSGVRTLDDLYAVLEFFEARAGRLYGFRFKDFSDFRSAAPGAALTPLDQDMRFLAKPFGRRTLLAAVGEACARTHSH